jgi:hypothetical protein
MTKGPFCPAEFVPTEWSTAAEKATFGNTLLHFIDAGCPRELFTKKFYTRLSMTFGNIAHYNLEGFYDTWFTRDRHRADFVLKLLRWPCHGDPQFTFSDAEYAIQRLMRERNYLGRFELGAAEELRGGDEGSRTARGEVSEPAASVFVCRGIKRSTRHTIGVCSRFYECRDPDQSLLTHDQRSLYGLSRLL